MIDGEEEEERFATVRFGSLLPESIELPSRTLQQLSGDNRLADAGVMPSGLQRRVAVAWTTEMAEMTCAHVRVLVGQQFGLPWLAAGVATFVLLHPRAETELYPGDLTAMALSAHAALLEFAPTETKAMLQADFNWMEQTYAFDDSRELLRGAQENLRRARRLAGLLN